jgi:hypothetical protein
MISDIYETNNNHSNSAAELCTTSEIIGAQRAQNAEEANFANP